VSSGTLNLVQSNPNPAVGAYSVPFVLNLKTDSQRGGRGKKWKEGREKGGERKDNGRETCRDP